MLAIKKKQRIFSLKSFLCIWEYGIKTLVFIVLLKTIKTLTYDPVRNVTLIFFLFANEIISR